MITEELERIKSVTAKAFEFIESGDLNKAHKIAISLRRSWAASDAARNEALIESYILLAKGKKRKAKELCLNSMGYLWCNQDALFIIRQSNGHHNHDSKWFEISVKGGDSLVPALAVFDDRYYASYLVLANEEFEAVRYVDEVAKYSDIKGRVVEILSCNPVRGEDEADHLGVYQSTPFSYEDNEVTA